jgi:hypothetical protein
MIQKPELKTKKQDRFIRESELKTDRHNCQIQKSELKTKKQDRRIKESGLKMDRNNQPIQKSELDINRLYHLIQSEDRIGIGRLINQTFCPPLAPAKHFCHFHSVPNSVYWRLHAETVISFIYCSSCYALLRMFELPWPKNFFLQNYKI